MVVFVLLSYVHRLWCRSRSLACFVGAAFMILGAATAHATKPCNQPPCWIAAEDAVQSREQCRAVADWVAVGTISEVERHPMGHPVNKDFARFTFNVVRWEHGNAGRNVMHFTVGWCHNRRELPPNTAGEFRFYGSDARDPYTSGPTYYDFEPLATQ